MLNTHATIAIPTRGNDLHWLSYSIEGHQVHCGATLAFREDMQNPLH